MALLTDGLWISGIELNIQRFDAPIPDNMKDTPIKVELTNTQIKAIAAVLGLGLENGSVVCYNDNDLDKFMKDPKDSLIEDKYRLMTAEEMSKRRVAAKAFEPIVRSKNLADIWNQDGMIGDNMTHLNGDGTLCEEGHIDPDDAGRE